MESKRYTLNIRLKLMRIRVVFEFEDIGQIMEDFQRSCFGMMLVMQGRKVIIVEWVLNIRMDSSNAIFRCCLPRHE